MFLTDTQLVLLKIIDIETFCDLETDLDFGRDEIFARTDQLRIKRNSEDAENQRLKDLDDLCALLCHNMSPDISLVILNLIISRYEVHGAVGLPHFLKVSGRIRPLVAPIATFDYQKYADILSTRYFPRAKQ